MAFGTEHAAAISEEGLLYTWGHNHCEQLGITLQKHDEEAKTLQNSRQILTKIFYAGINATLLANKSRQNDDPFTGGNKAGGGQNLHGGDDDDDDNYI